MRKIALVLSCICLLFFRCGNNTKVDVTSRKALKNKITEMEDSIALIIKNPKEAAAMPSLTSIELINRLTAYYIAFPKDEYSADCLFKLHMKFSELNANEKALAFGDTLLLNFPNYKNREFLLESMASTYDLIIEPRDTSKVRYYYSLLLKDIKTPKKKREDIEKRLKFIELDFFSYVNLRSEKEVSR